MMFHTLLLASGALVAPTPSLVAIKVGRAETVAKGVIEHAVLLVEDGKIVTIGEDLEIERGIPVLDRPTWVVTPGFVSAYSRLGLDGDAGEESNPDVDAYDELYPASEDYAEVVKSGVTTLGLYPPGNGIPGRAVVVRPFGKTRDEMLLERDAYLKIVLRASVASKKMVRDGFKKADEHAEKEKKNREKWDKEQEQKKKKAPAKADDKKTEEKKVDDKKAAEEEKKEEPKPDAKDDAKAKDAGAQYTPLEIDPKTKPFVDLRNGDLRALVSISSAAEYLHFLDAIDKEKFEWDLRLVVTRELDFFYVASKQAYDLEVDGIGDRKVRVALEPSLTMHPGTLRQRNPAQELSKAGAKIVFVPRVDDLNGYELWLRHVGEIVNAGLDRDVALRALTLEPAEMLDVADRVGSLEKGKDANMVFFDGDPFEASSRIQAVMLDGRFVFGEVGL
ncbi:MAG: amidohydrolase family protein [Planctomycetota bacterium]